jgi:hypothetical protein
MILDIFRTNTENYQTDTPSVASLEGAREGQSALCDTFWSAV